MYIVQFVKRETDRLRLVKKNEKGVALTRTGKKKRKKKTNKKLQRNVRLINKKVAFRRNICLLRPLSSPFPYDTLTLNTSHTSTHIEQL